MQIIVRKIIIATGDTNQLETCDPLVEELGDQYDSYVNHCIDTIFPNSMFLKENKRLRSDEDKKTLKKYFKFTDDIKTINNIAYRNETCNTVSKTLRKLLQKQSEYEKREIFSMRTIYKNKRLWSVPCKL